MIYALLFAADAVFAVLFIKAGYPESTKKGFVFKMFASCIFLITGIYSASPPGCGRYSYLIIAALCAGLIGDVFLTFDPFIKDKSNKKKSAFFVLLGGLFFIAGHGIYIAAFAGELKKGGAFRLPVFLAGAALAFVSVFALIFISKVKPGKALAAIAVYAAAISCMFAMGLCLALGGEFPSNAARVFLIAAPLLFIISDSSLLLKAFDKERFDNLAVRSVNLGTYYLAQMLFAVTAGLIK